ncbi:sugar phosphate nucleotidyltransferase [Psychrobacillus sp. FSL K6-1415]|uniref:sugar phosphate nucleotidyltransferase n=1 Tax=Psychrobacillus sp. FSL K6-1415 TaxID=2921544 RepID=UPI0030FC6B79
MKIIVLSGGSGKRLWPMSTDQTPKHLLQLFVHEDKKESMLQRVIRQITTIVNKEDIIIATTEKQYELVSNQVPDITVIKEPEGRDTFAAIALGCSYIISNTDATINEVVAVVSADAYVDYSFYEKVISLSEIIKNKHYGMGLVGIKPTSPTSKFGYMIPKISGNLQEIDRFIEKPEFNFAKDLIKKGALWNSGVFVFPLKTVLNELTCKGISTNYDDFLKQFSCLPKRSFDYEIIENSQNIVAVEYDGLWDDLGTWEILLEKIEPKISGNVTLSQDCNDVFAQNELEIPIKLLGLSNLIVIATKNGILISDKYESSRLKEILD